MSTHYGHVDWLGICYRHTWNLQPLHCFLRSLTKVVDPFLANLRRSLSSEKNIASSAVKQGSLFIPIEYMQRPSHGVLFAHFWSPSRLWTTPFNSFSRLGSLFVRGCAKRKKGLNQKTYLLPVIGYSKHWGGRNPKGADVVYQQP